MSSEPSENQAKGPSTKAVKAAAREKRLKAALRANLKRRKAQGRERSSRIDTEE